MIYDVNLPIEAGTVPSCAAVDAVYTLAGENYWLQVLSTREPVPIITEQAGLLVDVQPIGTTTVIDYMSLEETDPGIQRRATPPNAYTPVGVELQADQAGDQVTNYQALPTKSFYDRVGDSEAEPYAWLLHLQTPGPGQYNLRIRVWIPGDDEQPTDFPLQVMACQFWAPEHSPLQSQFGTHFDYPNPEGGDEQQIAYDWFNTQPAYIEALAEPGATERDGFVAVYKQINDDLKEIGGLAPYMAQLLEWHAGNGIPQTGVEFLDCDQDQFAYTAIGEAELAKFKQSQGWTGGAYTFCNRPGVWSICGQRQDRILVEGDPEQSAANLALWYDNLARHFGAQLVYAEQVGIPLTGYIDEIGPHWDSLSGTELAKWTIEGAQATGYTFGVTVTGPGAFEYQRTFEIDPKRMIFQHDTGSEWITPAHIERVPFLESQWGYVVWDDSVKIDGINGHRNHVETHGATADSTIKRFWLAGYEGILFWSVIAPEYDRIGRLHWNRINHWLYEGGLWSIRIHRWGSAMRGIYPWLEYAAEHLGENGRYLLTGYIEGLDGADLRAMLYDICEEIEPIPEYHLRSASRDRVSEIRVDWDQHPAGEYLLWQTRNTDLSSPANGEWLPSTEIIGDTYYVDQLPIGGEEWRYRVDYWTGEYDRGRKVYVRMTPDLVGLALQPALTLEDKLRAGAQRAVELYGVRVNSAASLTERIREKDLWPNINESGDERIPDIEHEGKTYRYQRAESPDPNPAHPEHGDPVIIYCEVGKWDELIEIKQFPTEENQ